MRQIKLFFAGDWSGVTDESGNKIDCGVTNRLVSYAYPKLFESWMEVSGDKEGAVMIDSGAFSAWNKGQEISLKEYINFAHQCIERAEKKNKTVHIVNLDVIPGKAGQTAGLHKTFMKPENKDLIESAAKRSHIHFKKLKREGIDCIPVFHQGEDFKWLDRMLELTDYVGISPANDLASRVRNKWMEDVFNYLHKNGAEDVKTHGFAVTSTKILKNLPWESCDAATWRLAAAKGDIFYPRGGFQKGDYSVIGKIYISKRKGVNILPQQVKWLKEDGYEIEDLQTFGSRAMFNIRFFLGLEKWLNLKKKEMNYKPVQKLF